jgi:apolipoprotein N-acyltransferase
MNPQTSLLKPGRGKVVLPALAAGIGLALSLPPWGWWILAFPAAGLLFWRLGGLRARTRLWAGWVAGIGLFGPGLIWARSFTIAGAIALIAFEALTVGLGCLVVPRGPVVARVLAFPAALTLAEAVRQAWPFGGLPLGGVFLGQAGGPLLGVARLAGPLGLTAVVFLGGAACGALIEGLARTWRDHGRIRSFRQHLAGDSSSGGEQIGPGSGDLPLIPPVAMMRSSAEHTSPDASPATDPGTAPDSAHAHDHPWRGALAGHGGLLVAGVVAGIVVIAVGVLGDLAPDGGSSVGQITTAAVQGGGSRGFRKYQIDPATVLAAHVAATEALARQTHGHGVDMVLWPEDVVSLGGPLADDPELGALSDLARLLHTTLVVGVTEDVSTTAFRNEVVAFGPDGALVGRYEKVHRVPFGEFVPLRSLVAHLGDLTAVPRDAIPGRGSGLLVTPAAPLGTLVSFEVFYADRGRSSVRAGAELLIVPTNTSSYTSAQVPTQEVAAAEVQAVTQGRDLLQAAPTGYSAAITNRGALLQRSVLGTRQILRVALHRRTGRTCFVSTGPGPLLGLAGAALATGWWCARRRKNDTGG